MMPFFSGSEKALKALAANPAVMTADVAINDFRLCLGIKKWIGKQGQFTERKRS